MKRNVLLAIFAFSFVFSTELIAQKVILNREVESPNGKILLGQQTRDQFEKEPYSSWFVSGYKEYVADEPSIEALRKYKIGTYNITLFLGTWCGDSHREIPRLLKVLDLAKYPKDKMKIIGLNRKKEGPNGEEVLYNLKRVPTIIVEKNGKEVGRIIETPETGYLEKDLLQIITPVKKEGNKPKK